MAKVLKQNWTEVKKHLKYCNDKDLLGIIQNLYSLNKSNKEYVNLKFLAGNNPEHKEKLVSDTIDSIHLNWSKTFHDPYAYGGITVIAKITPIKAYVTAYKKAIGIDDGYIQILTEYIDGGSQCLYSNCAERSDTIYNSINSIAEELFILLKSNTNYISALSKKQQIKLKKFSESYHMYDDTLFSYKEISEKLNNYE